MTSIQKTQPAPAMPSSRRALPAADTERILAEVLAGIMRRDSVDVNGHFFDDLGADSLVMAHFCARLRKRGDVPPVSMKDIYRRPTIAGLVAGLAAEASATVPAKAPSAPAAPGAPAAPPRARDREVALCGTLQLLSALAYLYAVAVGLTQGYHFVAGGSGILDMYARALTFATAAFAGFCLFPVLAKWLLVGRWRRQQFRIWSLEYLRFWIVKWLVRTSPLVLFAGTPVYVLYLRALGAKIGRNALIQSRHVPICADLLTVGDNAVVRKDAYFNCYRANAGLIETGPVCLGRDAVVGEMTVLDIDTALGDGAQLGHSSSLHAGQSIPRGEHRHGSPATHRTAVDYRAPPAAAAPGGARKAACSLAELLPGLAVLPLLFVLVVKFVHLLAERPHFATADFAPLLHWTFYADALATSAILFLGSLLIGLIFVAAVPRLLNLALEPGRVYPLYGFHYWADRTIRQITNVRFFTYLFGDSSYIVHYLRWIGYDLSRVVQTGSNFGMDFKHDNPFLVTVGSGTMVADGLSVITTDYSSTSFRVSRAAIGAESFVGNFVAYPSQAKTGDNCLLATKVMVPLDGQVREGTGLLGSPSFEIPRSVLRDRSLGVHDQEVMARALQAKNRHNLLTMGLFLLGHWFFAFAMVCVGLQFAALYPAFGSAIVALGLLFAIVFRVGYFILLDRLSTRFRPLQPLHCSIYDPRFWSHERYWKFMATSGQIGILDGTPFKGLAWRLLGVRMGRRVFDDGCGMTESSMVAIGDDCTLNMACIIQPHSQEDGGFKSDRIEIGKGCTLGVGAWVHYGAKLRDGAQLAPDAFLMKGQEVAPDTCWAENPAREIQADRNALEKRTTATDRIITNV